MKKWEKIILSFNKYACTVSIPFYFIVVVFQPFLFLYSPPFFRFVPYLSPVIMAPVMISDIPVGITGIILSRKYQQTRDMYFICGFNILVGIVPWVLAYFMFIR